MSTSPLPPAVTLIGTIETHGFVSDVTLHAASDTVLSADHLPPIDAIIADENTARCIEAFRPQTTPLIVVPAGEACKEITVLARVLESLAECGLTRESIVASVGGGAVTDLGAFAASVYLRGIAAILIPTSLLGMVDAAIGGKTGIDLQGYKNLVGTFAPAREVRIAPDFVKTLSDREYKSGLAEVIKAGLLGDAALVTLLEEHVAAVRDRSPEVLRELITRAARVKIAVVNEDLTESGRRATLNLGHTFGHALEAVLGLGEWTHGEAVAWGIGCAMRAGVSAGITDAGWADQVTDLLGRYDYQLGPVPDGIDADRVIAAMQFDKKRRRDGLRFIVQRGPQDTVVEALSLSLIRDIL